MYTTQTAMPTGLQRYHQSRNFHFITFSCYQRLPFLASDTVKDRVEHILEQTRKHYGLCIAAYVLMPEHIHLLTNEPATSTLATVLQVFKQKCSREFKLKAEEYFWLPRYYDFNVSSDKKRIEKIRYIHRNPVKRGLVVRPEEYPWSSFRHYATGEMGTVEIESEWTGRRRERMAG